MAAAAEALLGPTVYARVKKARLLMVGAGGIGCELLKNLVLSGFDGRIEVVDLDTIDLSNLNRQFLFQKRHIGQSKAQVARESALRFNAAADIVAHHKSIMDPAFNIAYFSSFDLVLNALDNIAARRHVNRLCLAANVPLIESGTAGYLGQVSVICKGRTECYECQPIAPPKTFPVCTIRSTPSSPIHCIVWAKDYLLAQLFGAGVADEEQEPVGEGTENTGASSPPQQARWARARRARARLTVPRRILLDANGAHSRGAARTSPRGECAAGAAQPRWRARLCQAFVPQGVPRRRAAALEHERHVDDAQRADALGL